MTMTDAAIGTDALLDSLYWGIVSAHSAIRPAVAVTPLVYSERFSVAMGCEVYLKCEHQQATGSFKYRGAYNKVRLLSPQARTKGICAATSGNHGLAMALACQQAQVNVTIYTPQRISPYKIEAMRALGATVIPVAGATLEAELLAEHEARRQGKTYVSPYNDLDVIAGQGTVGMEINDQQPDIDAVFCCMGGGGLATGLGAALSRLNPGAEIIGCSAERAGAMHRSLDAGQILTLDEQDTLAQSTAGNLHPGAVTFSLCERLVDRRVLVTEEEIRWAMRAVAVDEHWIVEGAAGASLAGALKLAHTLRGKRIAIVLCGRNVEWPEYLQAVS
jgi:threonine dehydratase